MSIFNRAVGNESMTELEEPGVPRLAVVGAEGFVDKALARVKNALLREEKESWLYKHNVDEMRSDISHFEKEFSGFHGTKTVVLTTFAKWAGYGDSMPKSGAEYARLIGEFAKFCETMRSSYSPAATNLFKELIKAIDKVLDDPAKAGSLGGEVVRKNSPKQIMAMVKHQLSLPSHAGGMLEAKFSDRHLGGTRLYYKDGWAWPSLYQTPKTISSGEIPNITENDIKAILKALDKCCDLAEENLKLSEPYRELVRAQDRFISKINQSFGSLSPETQRGIRSFWNIIVTVAESIYFLPVMLESNILHVARVGLRVCKNAAHS